MRPGKSNLKRSKSVGKERFFQRRGPGPDMRLPATLPRGENITLLIIKEEQMTTIEAGTVFHRSEEFRLGLLMSDIG